MKRRKSYLGIALVAALILSSACADNGDEPLKIQKADARVQQLVTTASAQETAKGESLPSRVKRTYTSENGTLSIHIDASIEAPAVPMPSASVSSHRFTDGDLARIINALSEDGVLYSDSREHPSSERIREKIASGTALLAAIQAHPEAFNQNSRLLSTGE